MEGHFAVQPQRSFKTLVFLTGLLLISFKLGSAVIPQDNGPQKPVPKKFPQGYFVEPTDSSLKIAGNFGEIRPNHFHGGLDVKTGGREGTYILAVADGYVSRIKISPYGYGKCLYITHPNGYVSVYAHLQRLYGKVADYLEQEQYKAEAFDLDIYPDKDLLKLRQCDTVAISGNTGGSQSPHLHFEIRDEITEHGYNPFLFGYKIDDTVPPVISLLKIYAANDSSSINGKSGDKKIGVFGRRGRYAFPAQQIRVNGDIGFGIETVDYGNIKEAGKLGAYSIDLYIDNERIYYHELNEIGFDETRYINSHIDYTEEARSNRAVQKCFLDKNNLLSIYQCAVNGGLYHFKDNKSHYVKFIVKDFFGNASKLEFYVTSTSTPSLLPGEKGVRDEVVRWNSSNENKFEAEGIKLKVDARALYQDLNFEYSVSKDTLPGKLAPVHSVHKQDVPVHVAYTLSIRAKKIPDKLQSKATIVLLDGNNVMTDQKGTASLALPNEEGKGAGELWITTQTKYFGRFTVALDTVAPMIKPYNISSGRNMSRSKIIGVTIGDNLSGIKSYRATIDGKWILMEFEYKKALLFYEFDEHVAPGKHTFRVEVTDGKDNVREYKAEFTR